MSLWQRPYYPAKKNPQSICLNGLYYLIITAHAAPHHDDEIIRDVLSPAVHGNGREYKTKTNKDERKDRLLDFYYIQSITSKGE